MKKLFLTLLIAIIAIGSGVGLFALTQNKNTEGIMAYCTVQDLESAYGADRISAWSRLDPDTADKAIVDAGAEIDGYLLSGGYPVPLPGAPATIQKYCIDIASANLVISAGVLKDDPGGNAVIEQAKIARRYLEKVAEGKFKIPGYSETGEAEGLPSGNVRVSTIARLDLRGYRIWRVRVSR
jgi:phage gp36-like protein